LPNCPSQLRGGLLYEEWGNPGWWLGRTIVGGGGQDFILGAGAQFRLSRDFTDGCRTWDLRGHAYDVLVRYLPAGCAPIWITMMLLDMSDRLPLQSSHSMFCCSNGMDYRMMIMVMLSWWLLYYFIYDIDCLLMFCLLIHVIAYRCKPNTWHN
jgi:hypothetical protein